MPFARKYAFCIFLSRFLLPAFWQEDVMNYGLLSPDHSTQRVGNTYQNALFKMKWVIFVEHHLDWRDHFLELHACADDVTGIGDQMFEVGKPSSVTRTP